MAYISQLELARALEFSVRRANLPYVLSQGFSPHMKVSFGRALSVGLESYYQIFDIYLSKYIKPEDVLRNLKKSMPQNLEPFDCCYVDNDEVAASEAFKEISYMVVLDCILDELTIPKSIEAIRKKKTRVINVKDYIIGDLLVSHPEQSLTQINFTLGVKKSGSLKPDVFIENVLECSGVESPKVLKFCLIKAI